MTLDIKGGRKNTAVSSNKYVVLEELILNSIDSYLIRRHANRIGIPELLITLDVEIFPASLIDGEYDLKISCTDNGAGFGEEQVKAFVTKDTSYKDYLKIIGIGKCKGAGRIQFFHYFDNLKIDSIYADVDGNKRATLNISSDAREITEAQFSRTNAEEKI